MPAQWTGEIVGEMHLNGITGKVLAAELDWRYDLHETVRSIEVNVREPVGVRLYNRGRKTVCPDITVSGQVTFTCCGVTSEATSGSYKVTTFKLYQGENTIQVSGSGTLTLTYREADL